MTGITTRRAHTTRGGRVLTAAAVASIVTIAVAAFVASWLGPGLAPARAQPVPAETLHASTTGEGRVPDGDRDDIGEGDGLLPAGVTVFDDRFAGVARLDAGLRAALEAATRAASRDGVELLMTSGWRSAAYQDALLADAIAQYGSAAEAARWVATAATSLHVRGEAADVGGAGADAWLADNGARFGLCRVYDNEPWHVELRPDAAAAGCPATYSDPTRDPRLAL